MPNDSPPAEGSAAITIDHVADSGGTVVQHPSAAGAAPPPGAPAAEQPTVRVMEVDGFDDRGNTVKYIYARDPHYVVYYSRLER